ncbi:GNAT family N-acetyltransferase [Cellulomonas sp. PhB143]|uniref:GNAT family N-acetyltransferase n=1 Tax=Cellulomonas sp. PhB143 TaxID=2485186 RepID=UPI000F493E48|nr:GNAT family N-acetyltransferase [Cellulomonas sp. PhB143]ROS79108.1 acetyltransferase (GNAT) family protein [Cellulomonas sp. PhB143]
MTDYTVRPVRADEWRQVRALRLEALQDEAAPLAFLESYEQGLAHPDAFWRDRAAGSSADAGPDAASRQLVAVAGGADGGEATGTWVGTVVVLVETVGGRDFEGRTIERAAGHVVGVYVAPGHRGAGVIDRLLAEALAWAETRGLDRARLYVHADNPRAQGAYRRAGFAPTGTTVDGSIGPEIEMARAL